MLMLMMSRRGKRGGERGGNVVDDEDADAAAVTCAPLAHFRTSMRKRE